MEQTERGPATDPTAFAQDLFRGLPRRWELLVDTLTFGQNARWRRTMIDPVAAARPSSVLDVATGTAGVALQLAERTGASIVGVDLTEQMLRRGQEAVARQGADDRIRLLFGRAEQLPFPDAEFDALTFAYLLRYVTDPAVTLSELARVVRPGGVISSLEFHVPKNPVIRGLWWLHTRIGLPVLVRLAGRPWYEVTRFLGPNISAFYRRHPLPAMLDMWKQAGIVDVHVRVMSLGGGVVIWGRKGDR